MTVGVPLIGKVLRRRWTLERVIGTGGTATVYAATHRNGSRVAIKVLHPSLQADPGTLRRFLREGYLANKIGVPDVVKVIDDDVDGDIAYLVMELLEGASVEVLRERVGGRLAAADVVEIGYRLLAVLEAAHAQGVLHRDIKPANLFRTVDPVGLKVLDFGIAQLVSSWPTLTDTSAGNETFLGTPMFTAPEQARGTGELDARTDLWAVGATLFTLLTGQFVHSGHTTREVLEVARERPVKAVREQLPSAPEALALVIDRALAFAPDARFPSATEMKAACEACRRGLTAAGERSRFFGAEERPGSLRPPSREPRPSTPMPEPPPRTTGVRVSLPEPRAGFWSGRVGRLWWFHWVGPCTDETWRQYMAMVQRMLDTGQDSTLACMAHRAGAPSALQRKELADFIERNRQALDRLDRFALVVDSAVQRGAIIAINWLVRKPFEERVFNSPVAAIKWLTESHPEPDAEAVRASIVAQVPRHSLWPSLATEGQETVVRTALP